MWRVQHASTPPGRDSGWGRCPYRLRRSAHPGSLGSELYGGRSPIASPSPLSPGGTRSMATREKKRECAPESLSIAQDIYRQ